MSNLPLTFVTQRDRGRLLPPGALETHAKRMTNACQFVVRDPLRMLALAVISCAVDDIQHRRRRVTLDVEYWAGLAEVPEAWLYEVLGNAREEANAA